MISRMSGWEGCAVPAAADGCKANSDTAAHRVATNLVILSFLYALFIGSSLQGYLPFNCLSHGFVALGS